MRATICSLSFLLFLNAEAQNLSFFHNLDSARTQAEATHKMIMVDVYTDWCGWCKVLDKTTYRDSAVVTYLNEHFVPLKLNGEKAGDGYDFATRYGILSYPSIYYIEPDNKVVHITGGYMEPANYLEELKSVVSRHDNGEYYPGYGSTRPDFPEFYLSFFIQDGSKRKRSDKAVLDSFYQHTNLRSEAAFLVLKIFGTAGLEYNTIQSNLPYWYEKFPSFEAADIPFGYINSWLKNMDSGTIGAIDQLDKMISELSPDDDATRDYWKLYFRQAIHKKNSDWVAYANEYDGYRTQFPDSSGNRDNSMAWGIYTKCKDKAALTIALKWMTDVVTRKENYAMMDTYAALLFATENYEKAELAAIKAIELGKADDENVEETESLLLKIRDASKR